MTELIASVVLVACTSVSVVRWLRVSQREHYIPGECCKTAARWLRCRPPNRLVLLVAVAIAGAAVVLTPWRPAAIISVALLGAAFPLRMTIIGRERRLRPTRRLVTLGATTLLMLGALIAAATYLHSLFALALAPALMPVLIDAAATINKPLESRLLLRHVNRARIRLRKVAPTVVAITGSFGKTTTKGYVRHLAGSAFQTVASPASFNNQAGLALTINEHLPDGTEVLVAEMGMYGPGEIRSMCDWIQPDIAVITAIGPVHLERVGSIEGIVAAKAEILEGAATAVLWIGDPRLEQLAKDLADSHQRVRRCGREGQAGLAVEVRESDGAVSLWADGDPVGELPRDSTAQVGNVACAVAVALELGVPPKLIASGLASLPEPEHRGGSARTPTGLLVLDDTFNSNPVGAAAALRSLLAAPVSGRRVVVTPGMVELGVIQAEENARFAAAAADAGATLVVVGWTNRRALLIGAAEGEGDVVVVPNRSAARDWVRSNLSDGDAVLWENDLPDHYP